MPTFLSEEAHEQYCDREGLPEDCVPEAIDEEPTRRIEYCLACGFQLESGEACPSGFCRASAEGKR